MELVPQELGAPNVITGILLTYRAFDTLGEVAVLFMVAAGVGLVLRRRRDATRSQPKAQPTAGASEIVQNGAQILVPLICDICRLYHHERSPVRWRRISGRRGDCVRRAAIAAGGASDSGSNMISSAVTESLAGVLFVLVGVAGLIFAGGFLDNRVLPLGKFGAFFSAGAIPCSRSCSASRSAAS